MKANYVKVRVDGRLSCARSLLVRFDFRLSESSEREISKLSKMDDVYLSTARHFRYELRLVSRRKIFSSNLERGKCAAQHKG